MSCTQPFITTSLLLPVPLDEVVLGGACDDDSSDIPTVSSNPAHENQYDEHDQDDTDDTYATVTEAVAVTAEAATEAAEQEDDENDDEYESERHDLSPVAAPTRHL